jgi:hypothetical protein
MCSRNKLDEKQEVELKGNLTENQSKDDSLSIAILTTDGNLLEYFKYKEDNSHDLKENKYINYIKGYPKIDTLVGDFNGDGKIERAWFKDIGLKNYEDCQQNGTKKSCEGTILFSDKTIQPLKIDFCPMHIFKNEGDLYGKGKDVIGVLPGWFSSGCRQYSIYTLKEGKWKLACEPVSNSMNMREAGIILIEKDPTKEGWAIIRESVDSYISRVENHKIPEEYFLGSSCQRSNVVEHSIKLN